MKKQLLFILLTASAIVARAQQKIIITGIMYDPKGHDALTPGTTTGLPSGQPHKGGFEYIQFLAVQDIDFSITPYSVVTSVNPGAFGGAPTNGWATGSQIYTSGNDAGKTFNRTYKFNLTSGFAAKGTYFYIGGPEKCIAGYWNNTRTADISNANWIRTIPYSNIAGDGIGIATSGLLANSGNPVGIAVFEGTNVTETSTPIDATFWGTSTGMSASAVTSVYTGAVGSTPALGYRMPTNTDLYKATVASPFLGVVPNKFQLLGQADTPLPTDDTPEDDKNATPPLLTDKLNQDRSRFLQLGGIYDDINNQWVSNNTRKENYKHITLAKDWNQDGTLNELDAPYPQLSHIEINGTKLASTLPVVLTVFNAKANNKQIRLNWSTSSEKNNLRFDILKSTDGITFNKIDEIAGHGTTQTPQQYSTIDNTPAKGINYYQLRQVDTDGKISLSKIIAVKTDFAATTFAVNHTDTNITILFENSGKETPANINLTDITGRNIITFKQNMTTDINNISFNVPYLASGIYIVSLVTKNSKHAAKIQVR